MKRRKFISIIILASSSLILSSCLKSSPAKTVDKFMRLMEKGKINEAITFLFGDMIQLLGENKTRLALYEGVKSIQSKNGIKSFKVNEEKITGDIAILDYTIKYKDGSQERERIKLVKKDEEWKISTDK